MAGKRLLDAARLVNAGSSVAKHHFDLRSQQWDLYSKTSSLGKAVKSQTDRVTVTASAAWELAKRFDEKKPSWEQPPTEPAQEQPHRASQSVKQRANELNNAAREAAAKAGLTFSDELGKSTVVPVESVAKNQEHEHDDGSLSSLRKRELQRQAERQIPTRTAEEQLSRDNAPGRDVFSERAHSTSPELSSLPRTRIPKHDVDSQGHDAHVPEQKLNQDVFYATSDAKAGATTQQAGEDDIPLAMDMGMYSSPRVSKVLGRATSKENPFAGRQKMKPKPLPEMLAAEQRRTNQQQETSTTRIEPQHSATEPVDEDTQKLAASIAEHAEAAEQYEMRESRVPSSRFGRLWQYGGLATSMAFGAVGEGFRRIAGGSNEGSLVLSESNMNRLVAKLSRMRGAALKLGQMMSFQDSKVLPETINTVLQRVQDSADYMPPSQRNQVMVRSLGQDWRDLFSSFEEKPFAAASIGQVHRATLASNGKKVAVKVQYPGVRSSIDSDLNNLSLLLTASRLLPKGLYLDKTIANARTELGWECDYIREAESCIRFKDLVRDEPKAFSVPTVYTEASGEDVLTSEFMNGTAVTKIKDLTQYERDWIGTQVLRLCLRELMEWRFMQTDPNWTNFLYNRESRKLELLDFGASRDFPDKFVEPYVSLLIAASKGDRDSCRDLSIELGYLTGLESSGMLQAHVDSILTLAEPFLETAPEVYDFKDQTITDRVRNNIGLMLRERMAPPPEETYSLHRKLSGAFLLCARLESQVKAREMFANAVKVWNVRPNKVERPE